MRKLRLSLALLAALSLSLWAWVAPTDAQTGPPNLIQCNTLAQASPVTATTTGLFNGVAGKIIAICGWHVTSSQSSPTTFQLEYGTQGGPCTTPVTITPAYNVTSTAPATDHVDYASLSIPSGAQLCVVTTGATVGMQVGVWISQF
jgi:hypothetical protein